MKAGDTHVGESRRRVAIRGENGRALVGHAEVGRACGGNDDPLLVSGRCRPPDKCGSEQLAIAMFGEGGFDLIISRPGYDDRTPAIGEQFSNDANHLLGRLARPVHGFGLTLAQRTVVVDACVAQVGKRQPAQLRHGDIGRDGSVRNSRHNAGEIVDVHRSSVAGGTTQGHIRRS